MPEGPVLTRAEGQACLAALDEIDCDYLVASGSLPRGVPDDFYVSVAEIAAHKGAKLVLDSSGDALKKATHHGVYLIKLSLGEMEQLVGRKLYTHSDQEAAVRAIVDSGSAEIVTLTLGRDGALLATRRGLHRLAAVKVEPKSTVGAGDSFLAAMTLGLAQGWSPEDTLARAAAAGTAALLRSERSSAAGKTSSVSTRSSSEWVVQNSFNEPRCGVREREGRARLQVSPAYDSHDLAGPQPPAIALLDVGASGLPLLQPTCPRARKSDLWT